MNKMSRVGTCRICNEVGHSPSKCPCLTEDTKSGFYSGGGGGGGHSHDEDDEHGERVELLDTTLTTPPLGFLNG